MGFVKSAILAIGASFSMGLSAQAQDPGDWVTFARNGDGGAWDMRGHHTYKDFQRFMIQEGILGRSQKPGGDYVLDSIAHSAKYNEDRFYYTLVDPSFNMQLCRDYKANSLELTAETLRMTVSSDYELNGELLNKNIILSAQYAGGTGNNTPGVVNVVGTYSTQKGEILKAENEDPTNPTNQFIPVDMGSAEQARKAIKFSRQAGELMGKGQYVLKEVDYWSEKAAKAFQQLR